MRSYHQAPGKKTKVCKVPVRATMTPSKETHLGALSKKRPETCAGHSKRNAGC